MAPGRFRVRQATPVDLPEIADVLVREWRQAHAAGEEHPVEHEPQMSERIASWEQDMLMGAYFWVVYDTGEDDALVGFSRAGAARDEDAPGPLELWHLHVLEPARDTGVADHLITVTIGDAPAHLWVTETDEWGIEFYRCHGFEFDGGERPCDDGARDLRMVRA